MKYIAFLIMKQKTRFKDFGNIGIGLKKPYRSISTYDVIPKLKLF